MNEVLAAIWSMFAMYLIVRYLNHRKFQNDMDRILREVVEERVTAKLTCVEPMVLRLFETTIKNYLLESKVVDKSVYFRWTNKEKINGN